MQEYTKTFEIGGAKLTFKSGQLAKQADGAAIIQLGETVVLTAAVGAKSAKEDMDFFPLTVDYRERAAAAGRFPGGYHKREGRPSEKEILTCRLTDRPIRPLFPKGWFNEVQVQSIVLCADGQNDPDILSILGASVALTLSDLPWSGPLGALRVGRVNGEFVAFPTHSQMEDSDLDLIYVGNKNNVVMYEGSAKEISEADFNAALAFAQEHCLPMIEAQEQLASEMNITKREVTLTQIPEEYIAEASNVIGDKIIDALLIGEKLPREQACNQLKEEMGAALIEKFGEDNVSGKTVGEIWYKLQKAQVRKLILDDQKRLDGRTFDALRAIDCQVGVLPRTHGSAVFTRGETQAIAITTLGTNEDAQEFDSYTGGVTEKKFLLHYSFPNFSVGETGRISGPGRREIGHGALAERSVFPVLPLEVFPYAIRITSDILESNGSSSMGTVCAASLALMDAGVPMEKAVAGISIGICTETDDDDNIDRYQLLTDIIGWEDAFCDMDCKIAGTRQGITGFQLDLKLRGLPLSIMEEAVESAREARIRILDIMSEAIAEPRPQLSKYAPRIEIVKVSPDKIGLIIGPGGKNIKALVERSGCEINIEDDGSVYIYSIDQDGMEIAKSEILALTAEIEEGTIYRGRVVSVKEFGCFVEVLPGKEGLCHVSELANFRVKRPSDIVKEGDEIVVKCIGVDEKGRVRLSRRAAMADRDDSYKMDSDVDEDGDEDSDDSESQASSSRGGDRDRDRDRDRGSRSRGSRPRGRDRDSKDKDDSPRSRSRSRSRDDEDRPSRSRSRDDDRPSRSRSRDDEDRDRPRSRDKDRERPRDDDDRPSRSRSRKRDEEESAPRTRSRSSDRDRDRDRKSSDPDEESIPEDDFDDIDYDFDDEVEDFDDDRYDDEDDDSSDESSDRSRDDDRNDDRGGSRRRSTPRRRSGSGSSGSSSGSSSSGSGSGSGRRRSGGGGGGRRRKD